jgi:hypothetical protein
LVLLHGADLDRQLVRETLNVILKFEADIAVAERQLPDLMRTVERAN